MLCLPGTFIPTGWGALRCTYNCLIATAWTPTHCSTLEGCLHAGLDIILYFKVNLVPVVICKCVASSAHPEMKSKDIGSPNRKNWPHRGQKNTHRNSTGFKTKCKVFICSFSAGRSYPGLGLLHLPRIGYGWINSHTRNLEEFKLLYFSFS